MAAHRSFESSLNQTLCTLEGFAAQLASLQHLALHSIALSMGTLRSLGQLLGSLPSSVTTQTLDKLPGNMSAAEKLLLCKAIARMQCLKQLNFPQWEDVVGKDAASSVVPKTACLTCKQFALQKSRNLLLFLLVLSSRQHRRVTIEALVVF